MSSKKLKRRKISSKKKKKLVTFRFKIMVGVVTSIIIISLFLLGSTMAWFKSSDTVINNFKGTHLVAEIDETFTSNNKWKPNEKTIKEIRVENTGEVPSFIRLSLYEFLINFEVDVRDQIGNGNLKQVDQENQPVVDDSDTDTWSKAAEKKGTFQKNSKYYIANQAWISDPIKKTGMVEYPNSARKEAPYKYLIINFSDKIQTIFDETNKKDYWLYDNGYFYYSRPLNPGETTINILDSITLSKDASNMFKGSLYKMKVYMDAHDQTESIFGSWRLEEVDPAYKLIKSHLE
ncbi:MULTISPECIES: BsaA family SipW-dependent biofilm matrix protein [Vagococcus]|uniref:Alternate signal-mediated exported protein, CPF_0494 family n=1 Tax=Vagococcus fluvialis bH819 TaxID=1255619 RepID=A0A1X6WLL5_9ENTE|nr:MULTISPECIES: BsaA family SipW-dependent biofilm matrix protein [Vagococcus]SLM85231.1 hypothetical protein FM121_03970 [Vagococcus fluvialis bH819]HCM88355.1 hypothetical protein [Vagococcus sp.]